MSVGKRKQQSKLCFSKKLLIADYAILVLMIVAFFAFTMNGHDTSNCAIVVGAWIQEKGYGMGQIMNTLRLALVGAGKGPGMYDVTAFIGKEECLKRIDYLLENLKAAE